MSEAYCVLKQVTVGRDDIFPEERDRESCIARFLVIHYTIRAVLFPYEIRDARNT
jgi:hypothetical protein